jgi:hypothetical protein
MRCAICKLPIEYDDILTVCTSWVQAGGAGQVAAKMLAHVGCVADEEEALKSGVVQLKELWQPIFGFVRSNRLGRTCLPLQYFIDYGKRRRGIFD